VWKSNFDNEEETIGMYSKSLGEPIPQNTIYCHCRHPIKNPGKLFSKSAGEYDYYKLVIALEIHFTTPKNPSKTFSNITRNKVTTH
jgi:hypothetical protein